MKTLIIYLDVDGVLNHSKSDWNSGTNLVIDDLCLSRYFLLIDWAKTRFKTEIRLCSTWQHYPNAIEKLNSVGINWDSICFDYFDRTSDILRNYLDSPLDVIHLVLDDSFYGDDDRKNLLVIKPDFNQGGFTNELLELAKHKLSKIYET